MEDPKDLKVPLMLPSGWHRKEAPCVFQGRLSGIIVLRIGSRDMERHPVCDVEIVFALLSPAVTDS